MSNEKKINVNLSALENVDCSCGNFTWDKSHLLKKVPGLMIGQPTAQLVPIEIYICHGCAKPHPDFEQLLKPIAAKA